MRMPIAAPERVGAVSHAMRRRQRRTHAQHVRHATVVGPQRKRPVATEIFPNRHVG
jgi:hypothetical protein